jgi:uncharacterized protein (TIGR02145 family)
MKIKKHTFILFMLFVSSILFQTACKKDTKNAISATATITADKQNVNQLELVMLSTHGITLNQPSYKGTIGGQSATLYATADKLTLLIPDTLKGNQTLSITIGGKTFSVNFVVQEIAAIADPVSYYENSIRVFAQQKNELNDLIVNQMKGMIDVKLATQDVQMVQGYLNTSMQNFQKASPAEQSKSVKFIEANKVLFEKMDSLMAVLNASINNLIDAKNNKTTDYEAIVNKATCDFAKIVTQIKANSPLMVASISLVGIPFTPYAKIVLGYEINHFLTLLQKAARYEDYLLNNTYSVAEEILVQNKGAVSFLNASSQLLPIKGTYRNFYSMDKNSTQSLVAQFTNAMQIFSETFASINNLLPAKFQLLPKSIENYATKKTSVLDVNAKYLSISNISNPKVTVNAENLNDNLSLSFETNETTNQNFNFDIVYNHPGFATFSTKVSATLTAFSPYSIAQISGDMQTGKFGQTLTNPIKIVVKNKKGNPCAGLKVNFTANNAGSVSQSQLTTSADGTVSVSWTLGNSQTTQTATVTAFGVDGTTPLLGSPLTFTATATCATFTSAGYEAIQIGSQIWMAKNLGDGAYGSYYTYNEAITVCPSGWHLPSDAEWGTLINYLGGEAVAGGKLKETGLSNWKRFNYDATNESCFTALPGGFDYKDNGAIRYVGEYGYWWSSTKQNNDPIGAWGCKMQRGYGGIKREGMNGILGFSVRCVRD